MAHSTRIALLIFFASLIAACSPEPSQLEIIAHQLSRLVLAAPLVAIVIILMRFAFSLPAEVRSHE